MHERGRRPSGDRRARRRAVAVARPESSAIDADDGDQHARGLARGQRLGAERGARPRIVSSGSVEQRQRAARGRGEDQRGVEQDRKRRKEQQAEAPATAGQSLRAASVSRCSSASGSNSSEADAEAERADRQRIDGADQIARRPDRRCRRARSTAPPPTPPRFRSISARSRGFSCAIRRRPA